MPIIHRSLRVAAAALAPAGVTCTASTTYTLTVR